MGFTALPLYPPTADLPFTAGADTYVYGLTPTMLFIVLMAAIPSAPPRSAASAAGLIVATLGVSFARTEIEVLLLAALVNLSTSAPVFKLLDLIIRQDFDMQGGRTSQCGH